MILLLCTGSFSSSALLSATSAKEIPHPEIPGSDLTPSQTSKSQSQNPAGWDLPEVPGSMQPHPNTAQSRHHPPEPATASTLPPSKMGSEKLHLDKNVYMPPSTNDVKIPQPNSDLPDLPRQGPHELQPQVSSPVNVGHRQSVGSCI